LEEELDKDAVVTDYIQFVLRLPYQGSPGRVWIPHNLRTSNSCCEICRWLCATG